MLDKPKRQTAGQRMQQVAEDELMDEVEDQFYLQVFGQKQQQAGQPQEGEDEEEVDEEFEPQQEKDKGEDQFDSDFSDTEDDDDDEEADVVEKRPKRKTLKPPGAKVQPQKKVPSRTAPQPKAWQKSKDGASKTQKEEADDNDKDNLEPKSGTKRKAQAEQDDGPPVEKSLRQSTREKTELMNKEREVKRQLQQQSNKRRTVPDSVQVLTQDELLAEAARTELENLASLEVLQAAEAEVKRKAQSKQQRYSGPAVRKKCWLDNDQCKVHISFLHMNKLPQSVRRAYASRPTGPSKCVVTGQPAKYRDPRTGLPFKDAEAYQQLQERMAQQRHHVDNDAIVNQCKVESLHEIVVQLKEQGFANLGEGW